MAVKTKAHKVSRALDFYRKNTIYFAIGKTTPWNKEDETPLTTDGTELEEVIGYRKTDRVLLITPHDGSDTEDEVIEFVENSLWRVVGESDALEEDARYIYVETTINPTDLPLGDYRQVALYSGLERKEGVSAGKFSLLPEEVESPGILEIIDNRDKNIRSSNTKLLLNFIIKF